MKLLDSLQATVLDGRRVLPWLIGFLLLALGLGTVAATRPAPDAAAACPTCLEVEQDAGAGSGLLSTAGFPARWHCGEWPTALGWLHVGSDLVIWGSYVAIPLALFFFLRSRPDLPFPVVFWLFISFILACGTVHLVEAGMFWWPAYRLGGMVKLATAAISIATVVLVFPVIPLALALRSPAQLETEVELRTSQLRAEARQREQVEAELRKARDDLELRVEERTAELRQLNFDLERSNRELEAFSHVASHDLKEPLRGISNYAGFLLEDYGSKIDEDGRKMLERMPKLCARLVGLIDSILEYSKLGQVQMSVRETDLEETLDGVLASLDPVLTADGVEILRPRPLPTVRCDSVRVGEVFRNLIVNGAKYNDGEAKTVEIGAEEPVDGRPTVFYVRDNGIGIEERFHERVFQFFKRLHSKDAYRGGSGIGLTITKRIVTDHGGRIWLESEPGKGTTFFFTLEPPAEVPQALAG